MNKLFTLIVLVFLVLPFAVLAETDDYEVMGLELEELLNLGSALLATGLMIVTIKAYKRNPTHRLKYVAIAFLLFALHGYLSALELIGIEYVWFDLLSSLLTFAILLSFFYGVVKK